MDRVKTQSKPSITGDSWLIMISPKSTGPLDGTNTKIKTMQQQAYGFRDHKLFKLKILNLYETRNALARNNLLDGFTNCDYMLKRDAIWKGIDGPQGFAAG